MFGRSRLWNPWKTRLQDATRRNRIIGVTVSGGMTATTDEDIELDRQWREVFGQPLPMLGAAKIARMVLRQHQDQSSEQACDL